MGDGRRRGGKPLGFIFDQKPKLSWIDSKISAEQVAATFGSAGFVGSDKLVEAVSGATGIADFDYFENFISKQSAFAQNFNIAKSDRLLALVEKVLPDKQRLALENVAQTTYEELHPLFQKTSRFLASLFGKQVPVNLAVDNKITPPLTPPQKEGVKEVVVISPRQVIQEITKNISYAGISREEFEGRLQDIATKFFSETSRFSTATSNNSTYINNVYNTVAGTNDIDMLHNVDISDSSTFTNGAITNSTITNSPISGSTGSFTTLSSDTLSATDATITNAVITNATTTNFFTSAINVVSSIFSSITGGSATIGSLTATSSATLSYTGSDMLITTDGTGKLVSSSTPTAAYYLATSTFASVFPYASSTAFTISGANGFQLATGLNGPLQANAGLVSATTSIGIFYGGTNATTFSDNALIQFDGIRLVSVSSPTIGSLVSTTTATSSFAGDLLSRFGSFWNGLEVSKITATSTPTITFSRY